MITIDLETTGFNYKTDKIIGVAICVNSTPTYELWDSFTQSKVKRYLEDPKQMIMFQNAKFDLHFLKEAGMPMPFHMGDTMLMSFVLNENTKHNLETIAKNYLNAPAWKQEVKEYLKDNTCTYAEIPFEMLHKYAVKDALYTHNAAKIMLRLLKKAKLYELYMTEVNLIKVVINMENRGVLIDVHQLKKLSPMLASDRDIEQASIFSLVGKEFNINSDDELANILYKDLKLPILALTKKSKKPKVDEFTLAKLKHDVCPKIIHYRNLCKLVTDYCEKLPTLATEEGVLRCNFNQIGSTTGRFSCYEPNLQNIIKDTLIRDTFLVRPGYTNYYFDYSQMELVLYSYFTNNEEMKNIFRCGRDLHTEMACRFYDKEEVTDKERAVIKQLNFGVIYGIGVPGVMNQFNIGYTDAKNILNRYYSTFPVIKKFNRYIMDKIRTDGFITNPFGRKRRLDIDECYKGVNALVQGTGGDILKTAMYRVDNYLESTGSGIIMTIHDELVVEVLNGEEHVVPVIKTYMEDFMQFDVPLKVTIERSYTNWSDAVSIDVEEV